MGLRIPQEQVCSTWWYLEDFQGEASTRQVPICHKAQWRGPLSGGGGMNISSTELLSKAMGESVMARGDMGVPGNAAP